LLLLLVCADILNQDTEAAYRISLAPDQLAEKQAQSRAWKAVRAVFIVVNFYMFHNAAPENAEI
jgi:hypothetical protein